MSTYSTLRKISTISGGYPLVKGLDFEKECIHTNDVITQFIPFNLLTNNFELHLTNKLSRHFCKG